MAVEDTIGPCVTSLSEAKATPGDAPGAHIVIDNNSQTAFCFDPAANIGKKELLDDFEMLKSVGMVDSNNCLNTNQENEENRQYASKFIQKALEGQVQIYATTKTDSNSASLIYTNSEDKKFIDNAFSSREKWKIAGYSTAGIAVGALVSEKVFKGEADKRKHWMVGATISGLTTGTTYFLLESKGLGNKMNLSKKAKENIIMYSGPIVGTVIGILKEVYDSKNKKKHTPDLKDAVATSLGAGVSVFAINLAF